MSYPYLRQSQDGNGLIRFTVMNGYRLSNILVEFIQSIALSKYVLSDSSGAPRFTIKISFYFY